MLLTSTPYLKRDYQSHDRTLFCLGIYYTGSPTPQPTKVLPSLCLVAVPNLNLVHQHSGSNTCYTTMCVVLSPCLTFTVEYHRLTFFKGRINPSPVLHQSYCQDQLYQRSKGMRGRGLNLTPNPLQRRCFASVVILPTYVPSK